MLAAQRLSRIVEMVNTSGVVSVESLSQQLGVSAMTVRRDLEKLNRQGFLNRCHGGAVPSDMLKAEESYDDKMAANYHAKMQIAKICAELVKEDDSVFLDAGTTTYCIAGLIKNVKNITIITNDLKIACSLLNSGVNLIVCGGAVQKSTGSAVGQIAQQMLSEMRVKISFIGAACIDEEFNIMTPTIEKAFMKKTALNISNRSYLVVDSSKFYRQALVKVVNMAHFSGVITNKRFSAAEIKKLRDKNIEIKQTEES